MLSCRSCRIQADYHQREATDNTPSITTLLITILYYDHNFVENDDDEFHGDEC